jgi:hypothetical protein
MHSTVVNHSVDPIAASLPFADWDLSRASVSGGVVDSIAEPRGGRTLTGTTTQRPAYTASDANFNGRPSATADTADDRLLTDPGTIADWIPLHSGAGSEVIVVARRGGFAALRPIWRTQDGSGADRGASLLGDSSGALRATVGNSGGGFLDASASGVIGAGQTRAIGVTYLESGSPKLAIWANNSVVASTSTWNGTPAAPSSSNPLKQLGVLNYVSTYDQGYGGPIARLLVWTRVLSTAERTAIVAALNRIYGAS